jgi:hypothetical protein
MRQSPSHEDFHDKTTAHAPRHRATPTAFKVRLANLRWPSPATLKSAGKSKLPLAASVLTCLALAAMASGQTGGQTRQVDTAAFSVADRDDRANRSYDRQPSQEAVDEANKFLAPQIAKAKEEEARKAAEAKAAEEAKALATEEARKAEEARKSLPTPVAGLSEPQMNNARRIVQAGQAMGLPKRAFVIAVATSMQECNLYNLASTRLPESYKYPNEGSGSDHDSVGLFQQRPSTGWGTVAQIMDPTYAATAFYRVLVTVPGWDTMALTYAAQRVQVSAFPTAYAKHEARAQAVVDALVP